jgi:pimeloyl-ACP methyl ester carboxylesterase
LDNSRRYGEAPYSAVVLHGGPGAAGEMAPVARWLSSLGGVLEPLQAASTLEGQVEELHEILLKEADLPATLIGWSWGAWLAFIYAARYPETVKKLVLVSSGPFSEEYAAGIMQTRLERLDPADRAEAVSLLEVMEHPDAENPDQLLTRFTELISRADAYDPLPEEDEETEVRYDIYAGVWSDAAELRSSGRLLELGRSMKCPVVAIHGDYDPHPAAGVLGTLSYVLPEFRFVLLENCGHRPWRERQARDLFLSLLQEELEED